MIYSDRGRFAEYPVIEKYIGEFLPNAYLSSEDLRAGRWEKAFEVISGQMPFVFPETRTDGAENVAKRLYKKLAAE